LIFFLILNLKQRVKLEKGELGSYWLELAILTLVAFIAFTALRALRWMETLLKSKEVEYVLSTINSATSLFDDLT